MLGNLSIAVGKPWWLVLLPLIIPPLVLVSARSLAGLGAVRRALAILMRTAVITLIVLALAEVQMVRRNDRLTTLFLVDVSQSVPQELRGPELQYVTLATRRRRADDLTGVIVFGKGPSVEAPPAPTELNLLGIESTIDPEYTDLGAALKLALATF
ncbi:MAG: VWA domain-containing protein, partial [Planctomycetaceae bacterium]|nr:VWA domain-containing protein [Planctomycetaceae bacterium]